jgi:hypothetical protein
MDTDTPESREPSEADTDLSAAVVALSRFLDSDGMEATIADDGRSVRVSKADDSYRVSLDGVEGEGPPPFPTGGSGREDPCCNTTGEFMMKWIASYMVQPVSQGGVVSSVNLLIPASFRQSLITLMN